MQGSSVTGHTQSPGNTCCCCCCWWADPPTPALLLEAPAGSAPPLPLAGSCTVTRSFRLVTWSQAPAPLLRSRLAYLQGHSCGIIRVKTKVSCYVQCQMQPTLMQARSGIERGGQHAMYVHAVNLRTRTRVQLCPSLCPPVLSCCVCKGPLAPQQQLQGRVLVEELAGGVSHHRRLQRLSGQGAAAPCYLPVTANVWGHGQTMAVCGSRRAGAGDSCREGREDGERVRIALYTKPTAAAPSADC